MDNEGRDGEEERGKSAESSQPPFVEVLCRSSGLHIEAVKEGEEPVVFGPNSILVNYGKGWNLQTVTDEGHDESIGMLQNSKISPNFQSFKKPMTMNQPNSTISFQYIGKILLAFAFMFLLGGIFTFFLQNLPAMNLSAVSSL
uniref:Uncharacterized protein n=1 Tax=Musa acuminata subsp. malaccensis TaxID=214687 RepID=A0A804HWI0_MUSAM|nr:PREDICTED: uncharacterized protein LOC103999369 isoform X2 [Musa acuminata subsp. malaccensis]